MKCPNCFSQNVKKSNFQTEGMPTVYICMTCKSYGNYDYFRIYRAPAVKGPAEMILKVFALLFVLVVAGDLLFALYKSLFGG